MEQSSHHKFGIACEHPFDVSNQITFRAERREYRQAFFGRNRRIGRRAHQTSSAGNGGDKACLPRNDFRISPNGASSGVLSSEM